MQFCKFSKQNGRKKVTKRLEKVTKRGFFTVLNVYFIWQCFEKAVQFESHKKGVKA